MAPYEYEHTHVYRMQSVLVNNVGLPTALSLPRHLSIVRNVAKSKSYVDMREINIAIYRRLLPKATNVDDSIVDPWLPSSNLNSFQAVSRAAPQSTSVYPCMVHVLVRATPGSGTGADATHELPINA